MQTSSKRGSTSDGHASRSMTIRENVLFLKVIAFSLYIPLLRAESFFYHHTNRSVNHLHNRFSGTPAGTGWCHGGFLGLPALLGMIHWREPSLVVGAEPGVLFT